MDKQIRACRICGCTDDNCRQCIEKTGAACYWIEYDLCSACENHIPNTLVIFTKTDRVLRGNEQKITAHMQLHFESLRQVDNQLGAFVKSLSTIQSNLQTIIDNWPRNNSSVAAYHYILRMNPNYTELQLNKHDIHGAYQYTLFTITLK